MSHRPSIISPQVKTKILLTTVAGRSSMDSYGGRIENMVIETVLFVAFVVTAGAAIVKAYEGSQDVLYGPYMKRVD
jgi:hypothetical protein